MSFYFFVEHMRKKSPRAGRINEKNETTEGIKSQLAWLSKFKCLAMFFKKKKKSCRFVLCLFVSLGFWSGLTYFLLLRTFFV